MRIDVLTTFPEMFAPEAPAALGVSIPGRARAAGVVEIVATDIRAFAANKHAKTDDRPFGGGPGMVMACQPVWDAVHAVEAADPRLAHRVYMTPQGRPLSQQTVKRLAELPRLLILAGHYEGVDERVIEALAPEEISIGDYVLSGGELAAMVLADAVIRLLPGALGDDASICSESFNPLGPEVGNQPNLGGLTLPTDRLLDCPHYTRPRSWLGREVPEVLISGDHARVAEWRLAQRLARTRARRPDLLRSPADRPGGCPQAADGLPGEVDTYGPPS